MGEAGQKLKRIRERLRLKYRDVEEASTRIAALHSERRIRGRPQPARRH